ESLIRSSCSRASNSRMTAFLNRGASRSICRGNRALPSIGGSWRRSDRRTSDSPTMHLRLGNFLMSHRVLIVGSLLALWTTITVAVTEFSTVDHLDAVASEDAQERMTNQSTSWAEHIANLASTRTALAVTIVGAIVLLFRRHWHAAIALAFVFPITQGAVQLVKLVIERPRPAGNAAMTDAQGFSFPSAHSATSVAVYATIAFILVRASRHGH